MFVIDLASRRVQILGSTPHPEALFIRQIVQTLTMVPDRVVERPNILICDRDRKWSGDVRCRLRDADIRAVLIPEHALNANANAERFVRSIKEECLDRLIPIDERHFRRRGGVRRALSRRTESPGTRQSPHRGPADDQDDESCATPSAARRVVQLL